MKDKLFENLYVEEQQKDLIISKNLIDYKKKTYYSLNNMKEKRTKKKKKEKKKKLHNKNKKIITFEYRTKLNKDENQKQPTFFSVLSYGSKVRNKK